MAASGCSAFGCSTFGVGAAGFATSGITSFSVAFSSFFSTNSYVLYTTLASITLPFNSVLYETVFSINSLTTLVLGNDFSVLFSLEIAASFLLVLTSFLLTLTSGWTTLETWPFFKLPKLYVNFCPLIVAWITVL